MKTHLYRFSVRAFAFCALILGQTSFADGPVLTPIPDPNYNQPARTAKPVQAPAATCKQTKVADVYRVYQLVNQCGGRIPDTGLKGVFNRNRTCSQESVLAEVFAEPCTCEDCASVSKVQEIRCSRGGCYVCGNDEYVKALIMDLSSSSRRVRKAATRSLKVCGLRVESSRNCVDADVPSIILY